VRRSPPVKELISTADTGAAASTFLIITQEKMSSSIGARLMKRQRHWTLKDIPTNHCEMTERVAPSFVALIKTNEK
jgi:hypothetical protein